MNTKRAFTLVEILVVIAIVGMLALLVTAAVAGAMRASKRAAIAKEMNEISMAIEHYKAEIGEYPPDMYDDEALVRHVKKRFPRWDWKMTESLLNESSIPFPPGYGGWTTQEQQAWVIKRAISFTYGNGVNFTRSPHPHALGALPLWLGGFPNADGEFSGFYADPECPFIRSPNNNGALDNKVFYTMQLGKNAQMIPTGLDDRIGQGTPGGDPPTPPGTIGGTPRDLVPAIGVEIRGQFLPFQYFRGRTSGGDDAYKANGVIKQCYLVLETPNEVSWGVPYAESVDTTDVVKWKNPTTYQLIHPGLDGKFSPLTGKGQSTPPALRVINTGKNITQEDLDNLTNFSDGKELKSILP